MEFHVWDFYPKMEVRLNKDYIEKIRSLKVEKELHIKETRGRKREFVIKKNVKLIALWEGARYHKIAERLYSKREWHGSDRPIVDHLPFISIKQFLTVHKVTGLPLHEMEQNVIEIRNHWAGHVRYPMTFPVAANQDWAWLFGLWYSCGGLITRTRQTKGYPTEERSVRFRVDQRVFERKVKPILQRIGRVPKLGDIWYINKGVQHKLDKNVRKGVGNKPKKVFALQRPIREIMEKFGLPTEYHSQREKVGAKFASRRFHLSIPTWIRENAENTHAFIEGFINGGQIGSNFREYGDHLVRTVELRFCSFNQNETQRFAEFFSSYLNKIEVTGRVDGMARHSKLRWLRYSVFKNSALNRMFENFDIQKPDLRARLALHYFMNALLYEVCKVLDSSEILVLGALIEKPMSEEELTEAFRFRVDTVKLAIKKLEQRGIIQKEADEWKVNPTGYRDELVKELWAKELQRRKMVLKNNEKFFSRCTKCLNIIAHNFQGPCGCGGQYQPISRNLVLSKFRNNHYVTTIKKIKAQTIPVQS